MKKPHHSSSIGIFEISKRSGCFLKLFFLAFGALQASSPYAVDSISLNPDGDEIAKFEYDSAGNRVKENYQEQIIQMGLTNRPEKIVSRDKSNEEQTEILQYALKGHRYLRAKPDGSKVFYLAGNAMEYHLSDSGAHKVIYIRNGSYSPIAQLDNSSGTWKRTYYLHDHLGSSLVAVSDEGSVLTQMKVRYEPWGQSTNAEGTEIAQLEEHRGFTGHENLPASKLIHMNARLFDPSIGHFTGPDPVLLDSSRLPLLNGFSYIGHNPLAGSDPSGMVIDYKSARIGNVMEHFFSRNNNLKRYKKILKDSPIALEISEVDELTRNRRPNTTVSVNYDVFNEEGIIKLELKRPFAEAISRANESLTPEDSFNFAAIELDAMGNQIERDTSHFFEEILYRGHTSNVIEGGLNTGMKSIPDQYLDIAMNDPTKLITDIGAHDARSDQWKAAWATVRTKPTPQNIGAQALDVTRIHHHREISEMLNAAEDSMRSLNRTHQQLRQLGQEGFRALPRP